LDDGRDYVYYQVWETLNLNTGAVETKKVPIYIYSESIDEYVDCDRITSIDDTNEVTSLLDGYNCWFSKERDNQNFHLKIVNQRHLVQIGKLRELDSQNQNLKYGVGIRLKLMMKETPNSIARRNFKIWEQENPELSRNLKDYVYKNITD